MMTFEQFQATRRPCADLGKALDDARWEEDKSPASGLLYLGALYIEEVRPDWPNNARARGQWYLMIGRDEWISDDLEKLERELFDFAMSAGYADDKALDSLIDEYQQWNESQGLNLGSADEHLFDESLTEAQHAWLRDFCRRWDIVER